MNAWPPLDLDLSRYMSRWMKSWVVCYSTNCKIV